MKRTNRFIRVSILLFFAFFAKFASAQTGPFQYTGDDNVCENQTKSYGVTLNVGSTYSWTMTPGTNGVEWDSTSNGNIITIHWRKPGTYVLSVTETNASGCANSPVQINIIVNPLNTVTHNITVCANQLPYTFMGHVFTAAATINDTVPGIAGGCDTARVLTLGVNPLLTKSVDTSVCANLFPFTFDGHVFTVPGTLTDTIPSSTGGCDTIRTIIVISLPVPDPIITGPNPVCESINGSTETYSTPQASCNTYSWTVSAGGTIIGSSTGNSIVVRWTTPGTKTVTVTETMCGTGCSKTVSKDFIVTPRPATTPITHN